MAREVRSLHADEASRRRLSEAGRRFVAEHYDRRRLARDYLGILEAAR
jgi:hypothetical protein